MILLETLDDHLQYHGITKAYACELFGRTPATLKRWNKEPPEWVLRIVQLMGIKPAFPDAWEDWHFDRDWLVDPAGNSFHISDVRNLWIERQMRLGMRGDKPTISSLKCHLDNRLKSLESEISITVNVGDKKQEYKKLGRKRAEF